MKCELILYLFFKKFDFFHQFLIMIRKDIFFIKLLCRLQSLWFIIVWLIFHA